ncbi:hypothetical protein GON09_000177 [Rhodococcus sp. B50]|nr:hypothetical protein [Rhodococcus sp. B50]
MSGRGSARPGPEHRILQLCKDGRRGEDPTGTFDFVEDTDPEAPQSTMMSVYVFDARAGQAPIRTREDAVIWI